MAESTPEPEELPDGIRIVDRRERPGPIEHLFAREDDDGSVVILGLDVECRAVYTTTFARRA
jgi:hypothetical protein